MQGDFGRSNPHGPCIMCFSTSSNPCWSFSLCGSSAEIIASTSFVVGILDAPSNQMSITFRSCI
ncbi:unnamed protein product [Brassica napus]|uniref:(rape) hypothetical protein n=1 Tax=Brassica napus TaxID=3708 RepID=A0A816KRK0_BRANA|nr:unnamed protein product [Brassica napus]